MDAQDGLANVVEVEASGRRESKVVAAVRLRSVDYEPIIEETVARFTWNTPDKRRKIYAQARGVVMRRLALMRLPEPTIEFEELALDLAIRRIERRWRAQEAREKLEAEKAIPFKVPAPRIERSATPITSSARLLRRSATPFGVAVALPVIAAITLLGSQINSKITHRSAAGDLV